MPWRRTNARHVKETGTVDGGRRTVDIINSIKPNNLVMSSRVYKSCARIYGKEKEGKETFFSLWINSSLLGQEFTFYCPGLKTKQHKQKNNKTKQNKTKKQRFSFLLVLSKTKLVFKIQLTGIIPTALITRYWILKQSKN